MLAQMTTRQLDHWYWHSRNRPFGFDWQDYLQGSLKHLLIQIATHGKSTISLDELLFNTPRQPVQEKTPEQIKAAIRSTYTVRPANESE